MSSAWANGQQNSCSVLCYRAGVSPEQIAAQLEAEADGLEAHADPVVRAAAKRLRLWANEVVQLGSFHPLTKTLHAVKIKPVRVNIGDPSMLPTSPKAANASAKTKHSSPAIKALQDAGWSVRALAVLLADNGFKISHTHLLSVLRGEYKLDPEIRAAITTATGVELN
jgi:hypothetical protein